MKDGPSSGMLTRRERHIMDVLYRYGPSTAREVMVALSGNPAYSTVRTQLRVLERKGHVRHVVEDRMYVYVPVRSSVDAREEALQHVIDTFFRGSAADARAFLSKWQRRARRSLRSTPPLAALGSSDPCATGGGSL